MNTETATEPTEDVEVRRSSRKRRRRTKKSKSNVTVTTPTADKDRNPGVSAAEQGLKAVPAGFGLSVPAFRAYSDTTKRYFPIGIAHGDYKPCGFDAVTDTPTYYSQLGDIYLGKVLVELTNLGYGNTFTTTMLRAYFDAVSTVHFMYRFLYNVRTLSDHVDYQSNAAVMSFVNGALSGKLVAIQRQAGLMLNQMPYPQRWVDVLYKHLDATTMLNDPFSSVRIFAPGGFKPTTPSAYSASTMAISFQTAIQAVLGSANNTALAAVLGKVVGEATVCENKSNLPIEHKLSVVNNLLNVPYVDGADNRPRGLDVNKQYFYRDRIEEGGLYSFGVAENATDTAAGSVFSSVAGEFVIISDTGVTADANSSGKRHAFGNAYHSTTIDTGPSVSHVDVNPTMMFNGIANQMFN
uniref:Capsid protein n=1 Tax=viral metagenome TaxID=1070528 RepID=A0A2V0R9C6_9ZZZZ